MPALQIDDAGVPDVASFGTLLNKLLVEAEAVKQVTTIELALQKSQFDDLTGRVAACFARDGNAPDTQPAETSAAVARTRRNAIIETAARSLFDQLIASTSIDSPDFVQMWNFLDLLSILSDDEQCDPALIWWLLEELLDSQTIAGCRIIFDYLESRREQLTAKHFKQKNLVILRSCNELLRRLSRAEDTAFCGRVFIFLFQSFPLSDPSSVNRRGEFHIENVTDYESTAPEQPDGMDVDTQPEVEQSKDSQSTKGDGHDKDKATDMNALYPMFWSLQQDFSQPLRLFEADNLAKFKEHLSATVKEFQKYPGDEGYRYGAADDSKKDLKRKRGEDGTEPEAAFNPKYLTSRDLFELEISDLSFRRHILVQALILLDFLLSLSAAAKEKYTSLMPTNRAVLYSSELSEDDTKWATDMKQTISDYLRPTSEGQYFFRMVDTVLMRDKNWVVWKMTGCQPFQRDPVDPDTFNEARATAQKNATSKRLRPVPMGSVSLDFLRGIEDGDGAMESLKKRERYELPELDDFKRKIADDDFEVEMPTNEETKAAAIAGKASKSWRALRIAGRYKMAMFDRIDDPKKVNIIFEEATDVVDANEDAEPAADEDKMPANRDPIIVSGPPGVGKSTLLGKLFEQHPGVFGTVVRHAARDPADGETNGQTFHFVKAQEFNQLRDGDRLVEYGTRDGVDYGTSTKAVEAVAESGKVPVIELDLEAAQFAKDMGFSARYINIKPPSTTEAYIERLKAAGKDAEAAKAIAESSAATVSDSAAELFDVLLDNSGDVDEGATKLGDYVFGKTEAEKADGESGGKDGDEAMEDVPVEEAADKTAES
ncbi:hypothetical protein NLU13_6941 [Sarocladium strictum]|uniref:Guanylate kinase-like domain-containing protein n=1 Tax=Sarocladium strictum TaxID=5046 RepID=A0AA39GFU8_SARSR|nr:hypothetical protein NLU13_6941 [Sarocladium strictum]